jgi:hypothetical protein
METTFLTVGIACLVAAVVGGGLKTFGMEIPVLNSVPRQLALGILGAAFVVVSIWLIPVPIPKIEIAIPKDGGEVDHKIVVRGKISGKLPARLDYLWGTVTPASGDYEKRGEWWPQNQITPVGEGWEVPFEIGDEKKDIGQVKEYLIAVFLMTKEANARFWDYKKNWGPNEPTPYQLNKFLEDGEVKRGPVVKVMRR